MTRPRDPRLSLLPPLDDEPGPMPQLSAAEADAIARGAVSRWAARPPGLEPADDGVGPSQPLTPQAAERLAQSALRLHARKQLLPTSKLLAAALAVSLSGAAGLFLVAHRLWPERGPHASTERETSAERATRSARAADVTPSGSIDLQLKAADARPRLEAQAATPSAAAKLEPQLASNEAPEELLARANALRAKRRWVAAESTYRQVATVHSSEQQRYVALVAAASIALQHLDKPGRALNLYQSALALTPRGNLSEEALYGSAECFRALKNPTAELKTLERLSREHPTGLLTEAAKHRVATLRGDSAALP